MFVHDRALRTRARVITLMISAIVAIQVWPDAYAQAQKAALTKDVEVKSPQKKSSKKRGDGHAEKGLRDWQVAPIVGLVTEAKPAKKKIDPIAAVLKVAYKQLGKPYRWAAEGPNAFDCSGFTKYVWQAAGVHLPHNSGAQRAATKHVPLDKMKPGDLIFSSGHVGMYVGKGKMIHSPHSGRTVSVDPIHSNAYGAGRPLA